jgi:lipoate-protein ligase A
MRWHFLASDPASGPENMALDEALMGFASHADAAVFRVYGWSSRVLSLGRNQRARDCYDLGAAHRAGISFVRRPTGGRALLHYREVTYSAVLACDDAGAADDAYHLINEVLLRALSELGVPAVRARAKAAMPPGLRPCFDVPSEHEIEVDGRKLVGSAQWRRDGVLLQHGSILLHDDQALIGKVLRDQLTATPAAATIVDAIGREPADGEVADHLRASLGDVTGTPVETMAVDATLAAESMRLCALYSDDAWTWRR